jgi:hypothetical protein
MSSSSLSTVATFTDEAAEIEQLYQRELARNPDADEAQQDRMMAKAEETHFRRAQKRLELEAMKLRATTTALTPLSFTQPSTIGTYIVHTHLIVSMAGKPIECHFNFTCL